jgi:putative oxidoreductase
MTNSNDGVRTDLALLTVRVVLGLVFLLHGLDKLRDLEGTEQFFDGLGIPAPALMAPFVAVLEFAGGIALIAGLLTPLIGIGLAIDMLVAWLTVHEGNGYSTANGGWELVLVLGAASLAVAVAGAGRFSVDGALRLAERVPGYPGPQRGTAAT